MATYTIKRSEWHRGKGSSGSYLLNTTSGKKCCIGFVGEQCGVPASELANVPAVHSRYRQALRDAFGAGSSVTVEIPKEWPAWFTASSYDGLPGHSEDLGEAYLYNDDSDITDEFREFRLAELFAKHGDTLVFVD